MMRWLAGLLIAAGAAALAATVPGPAHGAAAKPHTYMIVIDKMKFGPAPRNVRVGDVIVWVNKDMFRHTATARDRSFNLVLAPGERGKTIVKKTGATLYYCVYHPGMKGQFVAAK